LVIGAQFSITKLFTDNYVLRIVGKNQSTGFLFLGEDHFYYYIPRNAELAQTKPHVVKEISIPNHAEVSHTKTQVSEIRRDSGWKIRRYEGWNYVGRLEFTDQWRTQTWSILGMEYCNKHVCMFVPPMPGILVQV